MEPVEYTARPTTIKAYQFLLGNADEFIKMLWGWNYLTRLSGRSLTFKSAGEPAPGETDAVCRMYATDYLVESYGTDGMWKIETMSREEFEKTYTRIVHQTEANK